MRFTDLPLRLKLYTGANVLALLPLGIWLAVQPLPENPGLVALLLLFTALFATWKIELTVLQAKMTLTFAVVCLALLSQGAGVAVLCAVLGAFLGSYLRPTGLGLRLQIVRPPLHRVLFNGGNCALTCYLSALAFGMARSRGFGSDYDLLLALGVFTSCYFLLNTLGVSLAIAMQQRLSWHQVWKENFLWTSPGFFASASAAFGIQAVSRSLGVWALLLLPWLWVIYYSYRLYMDRLHRDMDHIHELNRLNQAIIASLATAIDAKDRHTCSHINRVQLYAISLAEEVGLRGPELDAVATGALVHDIGKLGIPDHILLKPGKLTAEEFRRIQAHVTIGAEILAPVPFPFPVVDVVLTHHERWDGLGYPKGLKEEEIPIGGRIISIVDVFDALTSNRSYRRALSWEEALQVVQDGAAKQFDPILVEHFVRIAPRLRARIEEMEAEARGRLEHGAAAEDSGSALIRIGQAAAEMAAACEVAHALSEQECLDGVYHVVTHRALSLLPVDTVVFYEQAVEGSTLTAMEVSGEYADRLRGMTIESGEGVAGWVAENQKSLVNVSATLDVARRFGPSENIELSAATAVPIVHGPERLGVLAVYTSAYSVLSEHHLHVLNLLAEHAAAAIQNLRRVEQQRELAFTDALTGLANSRCLFRHLERLTQPDMIRDAESTFSLVMLDLDGFKSVNDRFGHLRGDDLLRTVAERLLRLGRADDLVCRYAGDEFVLLLPHTDRVQADRVAERIRTAVAALSQGEGGVEIGASVGVATFPRDGQDARTLINAADFRMYEDKFARRRELARAAGVEPAGAATEAVLAGR